MSKYERPAYSRLTAIAVALMLALGIIIIVLDRRQVEQLLGKGNWLVLIAALLLVAVSYYCASAAVVVMLRVFGVRLEGGRLFRVGLVSVVLENLIAHPVGLSLRLLVLGRGGVEARQTVGSSLLLSYFKNLAFWALTPFSLLYIVFTYPLAPGGTAALLFATFVVTILLIVATAVVFSLRARTFVLRELARLIRILTRRDVKESFSKFGDAFAVGLAELQHNPGARLPLAALVLGDVVSMIAAAWLCFVALGVPVHLGALIAGFTFGITLTVVSLLPGDIGVQEASMAAVFALFGVPFAHGILVATLFRVVYYFFPFVLTSGVYWNLLRQSK